MKALELALQEVRAEPKQRDSEKPELFMSDKDLEIALSEYDNAKTAADKVKAFRAALRIAKGK